jgi:phage head maturation protease
MVSFEQDATGITAEFKIAKTTAGNDALEEAATGLRSDFSVGVDVEDWDNKDGVMAISASNLIEVSLVTDGAIPGAEVEKVAAVDTEDSKTSTDVEDETPTNHRRRTSVRHYRSRSCSCRRNGRGCKG